VVNPVARLGIVVAHGVDVLERQADLVVHLEAALRLADEGRDRRCSRRYGDTQLVLRADCELSIRNWKS